MKQHPASSQTEQHLNLGDEIPIRRVDCNNLGFWRSQKYKLFKFFLQYVKHVDARSNKEQFINKLCIHIVLLVGACQSSLFGIGFCVGEHKSVANPFDSFWNLS